METNIMDSTNVVPASKGKIFLNTVLWGLALWFFGYVLGFVFWAFVPKELIGWYILPLGVIATLWVLIKKIKRESFTCYFGLSIFWTIIAVVLDYVFIIKMLGSTDYYKTDVYLYYVLVFVLPIIVGWFKFKKVKTSQ